MDAFNVARWIAGGVALLAGGSAFARALTTSPDAAFTKERTELFAKAAALFAFASTCF